MEGERGFTHSFPTIPLPGLVVFPHVITPLLIGRQRSLKALEEALSSDQLVFLVTQRNPLTPEPGEGDVFKVGVLAEVMRPTRMPDGNVQVLVEARLRARLIRFVREEPFILAQVELLREPKDEVDPSDLETQARMRTARQQFEKLVQQSRTIPPEVLLTVANISSPGRLADTIASYLEIKFEEKQRLLEIIDHKERLEMVTKILAQELQIIEIEREIENRVREGVGESQKEFILRERLKAIQEELGERDAFAAEIDELRKRIERAKMPKEAHQVALKEVERLAKMSPLTPEATVIRTYLDWLLSLPWNKCTQDNIDIERARQILDEDHYGLKDVKERVLEFLAVRKLSRETKGPILCFIGPPGVGKTSVGQSIARAMRRKFIRISLGGVRDEAEIRGHRRTYVGALPGRIIQAMRTVGVKNPVFMLDEIDKLGVDFRGDPAAALLEALDPEQNHAFSDHYIEVPFDLSKVMFILTGNVTHTIPPALLDRLEIIHFPGYTEYEKLMIARHFLIPKGLKSHGLKPSHVSFTNEAIKTIIRNYTQEAGVRNLERMLASIFRKVAVKVAKGITKPIRVTTKRVEGFLGPRRYLFGRAEEEDEIATATALAWTEAGGDVLFVEVLLNEGNGQVLLTGQLGDVMQESAYIAVSYARSIARRLGIDARFFEKTDIHIHVPAGAIQKDGPSAGIAMLIALTSALTGIPVRRDVGMTGEITLRGKLLPVGGIREKTLAAHRAGLKEVILPKENEKDVRDLPKEVMQGLTFHYCRAVEEVLKIALSRPLPQEALQRPSIIVREQIQRMAEGVA
ncbi:MAG: endopeptidase La [Armatimonadota bacterium]|nr:endopeptidase La [Armatimonadota bacterium]MCX7777015.1 endopeptidase La [Armatimonadota bacterium]MDW8024917.1 endopeptidase La [Armatimonadota bacterium]